MNLFKKVFNIPKKVLYSELKPSERIRKTIETGIFPDLEKIGFNMHKSELSITRIIGDFKQEIYFQKNKWNVGNEAVMFTVLFNVSFPKYTKWHLGHYDFEPKNDGIAFERACDITNWRKDLFENSWYDLAKDDNLKIIELVKSNILTFGLDFFDSYSTKTKAIKTTIQSGTYFYRCPLLVDLGLINNNKPLAIEVIQWFDNFVSKKEHQLNNDVLDSVNLRKKKISDWN